MLELPPRRNAPAAPAGAGAQALPVSVSAGIELIELAGLDARERDGLLDRFATEVYTPAFPRREHREDPEVWRELLRAPAPPPRQLVNLIIARNKVDNAIVGGVVFEYYRGSHCGLVTYLVVAEKSRSHGLGHLLNQAALERLAKEASLRGDPPPPVFAETEDPALLKDEHERAVERLAILRRLGYRTCDLPYLQPSLEGRDPPPRELQLCAAERTLDAGSRLAGARLARFLTEFYASLSGTSPASVTALTAMLDWIAKHDPVVFHPF